MTKSFKVTLASFIFALIITIFILNISNASFVYELVKSPITKAYTGLCVIADIINILCFGCATVSFVLILVPQKTDKIRKGIQPIFLMIIILLIIISTIIVCICSISSSSSLTELQYLEYMELESSLSLSNILSHTVISELYKNIINGLLVALSLSIVGIINQTKEKDTGEKSVSTVVQDTTDNNIKTQLTNDIQKLKDELEIQRLKDEYKTLYQQLQNTKKEP